MGDLASVCAVPRAGTVSHQKELAARQERVMGEILSGKGQACRRSLSLSDGIFSFKYF